MARPKNIVYAMSAGVYPWIPQDVYAAPFDLTINTVFSNQGKASVKLQATIDNVYTTSAAGIAAFDLASAKSTDFWVNQTSPITAYRLNISSVSGATGADTITVKAIQTGY